MVHARAFSFTDDAINVAFPSMTGIGRIPSNAGPITGPQSANPSILLFQLRRAQSAWYQTLYESDPSEPLADPASYIWQMCHELREWNEALPETLPVGIRELFDLELKYSYVYCIAPSGRAPQPTAHGRTLIFEYVIAYIDRVIELAHGAEANPALYTYHDALRVFFMGSQFISVLRDAPDPILSPGGGPSAAIPLSLPGQAPPPPMPARSAGDNLERSIRCIDRVSLTLRKYGERWADADRLAETWVMFSREVAQMLQVRRQQQQQQMQFQQQQQHRQSPPSMMVQQQAIMAGRPAQQPLGMPAGPMSQGQGRGQAPPQEVKWVDMDIQQMMRGGGGM